MKRHISILAILFSAFAAVGLTGTAEAGTLRTYYKTPTGAFGGPDESVVSPATAGTPMQSGGKDFTATCPTGQKIEGWYYYSKSPKDGGTPNSQAGTGNPVHLVITDSADCWLCAHLAWITYNVNYDANGGSGGPSNATGSYNLNFTVSSTTPSKSGYAFAGWKADTNGKTYSSGASVAGSELCRSDWHEDGKVVTMTAQWTKNQYTISTAVEPTGAGSVTGGGAYDFGTQVSLKVTANAGWQFEKWKDGGTDNPRTVTVGAAAATYTAVFKSTPVTITFDSNGGDAPSPASKSVTYPGTYGSLATCARTGYTFADWWTAATGGSKVTSSTQVMTGSDHTLYAHWTTNEYSLTVNPNGGLYDGQGIEQVLPDKLRFDGTNLNAISVATRENYTLSGYYVSSSGGTKVYDGNGHNVKCDYWTAAYPNGTFKGTSDLRVYAIWTPNASTVTLDKQGGTGGADSVSVKYDTMVPAIGSLPTRKGYAFAGYYTSPNGGGRRYYDANGTGLERWTSAGTTKLYANWTPNGYKIQYELDGGSTGSDAPSSAKVGTAFRVSTPTRTGYTFKGWNVTGASADYATAMWGVSGDAASTAIPNASALCFNPNYSYVYFLNLTRTQDATVTLKANWTANNYEVVVDANGGSGGGCEPYTISTSEQTKKVTLPTKGGYSISRWTVNGASGGTPTVSGTTLTIPAGTYGKLTLTPTWTANSYDVMVDANGGSGGSCPSYTVSTSQQTKTITLPTKAGYSISKWDVSGASGGTPTVSEKTLTIPAGTYGKLTLTPTWSVNSYTVTFDAQGGTATPISTSVTYDSTYGKLAACERPGYTFGGWYTAASGGTKVESGTKVAITANQTLYAHWTANMYEVTYDNNFVFEQWANNAKSGKAAQGTDFAILTKHITAGNLKLENKKESGEVYTGMSMSDNPSANAGYYTFPAKGNTDYTLSLHIPTGPSNVEVYLFFFDAEDRYISNTKFVIMSFGNRKKLALTTPAGCHHAQIRFDVNVGGESALFQNVKFIDTASFGWIPITAASDIRQTYTYEPNVRYGDLITSPSRTGYTFDGWYDGGPGIGNRITADTIRKPESIRLYSTWHANAYTVTFNGNGGAATPTSKSVTYDSTYGELATCERTGYTFDGWWTAKSGGTKVESTTKVLITAAQTLYAHWTANSYTVTFDKNGGNTPTPASKSVTYDSTYGELATCTRTGYTLAGWYTAANGGTKVESTTKVAITAAQTLYAHWTAKTYKVTFNANGGTTSTTSRDVTYDSTYGTLPTPTRKGYDFLGWYTAESGGSKVETSTTVAITAAQTLYAHWEAKKYNLTIDPKGGLFNKSTKPTTFEEVLTFDATNMNILAVSVKEDGTPFLGYYTSGGIQVYDDEGKCVLGKTYWDGDWPDGKYVNDGNLMVEARWSDAPRYDVSVEADPAAAGTATGGGTFEAGTSVTLTATPSNGYSFAYWRREVSSIVSTENPYEFTASSAAAGTYTAVFTGNVYTVTFDGQRFFKDLKTKPVSYGLPYGDVPEGFVMDGYKIEGWYTLPSGQGVKKDLAGNVDTPADHTLYANWVERTEFNVVWRDLEGGNTWVTNQDFAVTTSIEKADIQTAGWPEKRGYSYWIKGWNPPLPLTVKGDTTITAVWESYSDVLDCSNLTFNVYSNWMVNTDTHFCVLDGVSKSCLEFRSFGGGDKVQTILPEKGTISFHWKATEGRTLRVRVPGESGDKPYTATDEEWHEETIHVTNVSGSAFIEFSVDKTDFSDSFCALDAVTWTPGSASLPHTINVVPGEHCKEVTKNPEKDKYDEDETVTLTATEKPGYAFCCWTNETGFATNDNPWTFKVVDDATYTATFTNCQYVVTLDPNGGTGGASEVLVTYDKPMPQLGGLPTRADGWTFNGYTNVAGFAYYDAQGTSAKNWDMTNAAPLFARWKAPDEYALTVSVIGRGAVDQDPPGAQHVANTQVKLTATPETGAVFAHWSDGDKNPERTVTMDGDITLTATFTNCQYVVTFDANGGSVSQKTTVVTYGEAYGALKDPATAPAGKAFVGWYTTVTGGTRVEASTNVTTAADHTLYARWEADVGDWSKALDCNNLRFEQTGGWEIGSDPTLGALNGTYVYTSTKDASLSVEIKKSGTLTVHYKGYAPNLMIVQVLLGGSEVSDWRIKIEEEKSYPDTWLSVDMPIQVTGDPVVLTFKCTKVDTDGCCCAIDHVTWTPEGGGEPTPGEAVAPTAAGVANGVFSLTIPAESGTDYGVWTNADLTVDSWGLMGEPQKAEGSSLKFDWTILPGFPQLFFRAHKVEYR